MARLVRVVVVALVEVSIEESDEGITSSLELDQVLDVVHGVKGIRPFVPCRASAGPSGPGSSRS